MGLLADIGSSVAGDLVKYGLDRSSARDQQNWQEYMSSTAYQRAALDLQKAGLNRILALGNPASTPSGAMAQAPDFVGNAVKAASARQAMELQEKQGALVDAQAERERATAENIKTDTALKDGQIQNLVFSGENTLADAALKRKQTFALDSNIGLNNAQSQRIQTELANILADTRLKMANASEAEFKKAFYEKAQPILNKLLNYFLGPKESLQIYDASKGLMTDFFESISNLPEAIGNFVERNKGHNPRR